jgi:hypothetical protein
MSDSFPVKPADLIAEKQWHSTADTEFEVVGLSADKAHVILPRARRLRADGSLIETVSVFYVSPRRTRDGRCLLSRTLRFRPRNLQPRYRFMILELE